MIHRRPDIYLLSFLLFLVQSSLGNAVSDENRMGLYIGIPVYFAALAIVAYFSHRWLNYLERSEKSDRMTGHYLGGRSFGPLLMAGTIFATQFSGYTVVGVPNEAFKSGFYSFRWIATFPYIFFGFICTGVRLRKASLVRNHSTPIDFITDRFRSQLLRYTILMIQLMASIVYLSAQVNALQSTFNSMFGFDRDDAWPVVVIMLLILGFEFAGGLAVVAMSDSIQGFVMVISFLCLPLVILKNFGGWGRLDPLTFPKPEFYQTPSSSQQWLFWQFSLVNICFFALPHFVQRIYAAKDLTSLKFAFVVQTSGPWLASFAGIFLGTIGVQMLADAGKDLNPPSPFTAIIDEIIAWGGFAQVIGIITYIASLAAIMSTADSLIIAMSQLITVETYWPFRPNASQRELSLFGKFASILSVAIALVVGILWKQGLGALATINFSISMQAVPSYIHGLYFPDKGTLHPWSIAFGALIGLAYVYAFFFVYQYQNPESLPINVGIVGVAINCITAILFDLFLFDTSKLKCRSTKEKVGKDEDMEGHVPMNFRPNWDKPSCKRFGEVALSSSLLNRMMEGFPEPIKSMSFNALFFFSVTMITPLLAEGQPVISSETGQFVSNPPVVGGLPWWFVKQIVLSVIPYLIVFKMVHDMPTEYPFDTYKIDKEGIDPNVLELTAKEMNFRRSFDVINQSITKRRSTVSEKMESLGLAPKDLTSLRRLSESLPRSARLSVIIRERIEEDTIKEKLEEDVEAEN